MNKKCPDCGSLNVEEVFDNESYCKDCFLHCATDDLEDATIFDRITASPETLAEKLVHIIVCEEDPSLKGWTSNIIFDVFDTYEAAIAATVARLKEMAE